MRESLLFVGLVFVVVTVCSGSNAQRSGKLIFGPPSVVLKLYFNAIFNECEKFS